MSERVFVQKMSTTPAKLTRANVQAIIDAAVAKATAKYKAAIPAAQAAKAVRVEPPKVRVLDIARPADSVAVAARMAQPVKLPTPTREQMHAVAPGDPILGYIRASRMLSRGETIDVF